MDRPVQRGRVRDSRAGMREWPGRGGNDWGVGGMAGASPLGENGNGVRVGPGMAGAMPRGSRPAFAGMTGGNDEAWRE